MTDLGGLFVGVLLIDVTSELHCCAGNTMDELVLKVSGWCVRFSRWACFYI